MNRLDVTAIGNALVDVIARVDDDFLRGHGIDKGSFALVDAVQSAALYKHMGPAQEMSGGSAANTIACLASLGAKAGFIGRVRDDQLGAVFAHDMRSMGIEFAAEAANAGEPTGHCLVLVAPDGERSMRTYLGQAPLVEPSDIDATLIARSSVLYIEGYIWFEPAAKQAIGMAISAAHRAGNRVALTLSDKFCVDMFRDEFNDLIDNHIDILFANEHEILALTQADNFDSAINAMRGRCEIAALTRSEKGAVILEADETYMIAAESDARLVDATGAGDAYAAGFLAGLTKGYPLDSCGRMGAIAAAEVISQIGARPQTDLQALVRQKMADTFA